MFIFDPLNMNKGYEELDKEPDKYILWLWHLKKHTKSVLYTKKDYSQRKCSVKGMGKIAIYKKETFTQCHRRHITQKSIK